MCYYNGIRVSKKKLLELLQQEKELPAMEVPVQSGFEYKAWPIITANDTGWQLELAHWEFIAPWYKSWTEVAESRKKFTTLNATAEKLLDSKIYQRAAQQQRCLVLSTGFYEWRHYKPEGASKEIAYPYCIQAANQDLMLMAGVYTDWLDRTTGELVRNFAIVTTEANHLMAQIHNKKKRMPLLLTKASAEQWIQPLAIEQIKTLLKVQVPDNYLQAHTIAKDFRTSAEPEAVYEYSELPPLER